jgi:hypothetical protein
MAVYVTESFDTKDAADAMAMHLNQQWRAYDAIVRVYKDGALWTVTMDRRNSCD